MTQEDGQRLICDAVRNLPDAGMLIVNTANRRLVVATREVAPNALERVIEERSYHIK